MQPSKTEIAVRKYREGDLKGAFAIFRTFKLGLSKEETRAIQIHHDCLCGRSDFYTRLGEDVKQVASEADAAIQKFLKPITV